ncbi:MAG: hypothetical protein IT379_23675 [Deltaproteobacteria bacterium]|nr:hypothetical protein [Deltaproteobacteria bacterium]
MSFALDVAAVRAELQRDLIADHYDWASDDANHSRDHKALAWRLERQFPKDWGARVNIRVEQEHELLFDAIRRELGEEIYGRVVTLASRLDEGGEEAGGRTPALPPGDDAPE